nr:DegT/DnrJ/EryC1/StrS family aminotransferase [Thiococcus pfennigii]
MALSSTPLRDWVLTGASRRADRAPVAWGYAEAARDFGVPETGCWSARSAPSTATARSRCIAPFFDGQERRYLVECIDSNFASSVGAKVTEFEERVAAFTGARHAVATVNGTAALHVALELAGVGPDDEVVTQALTFIATCNAIRYVGAWPVFVDVDRDTLGLSRRRCGPFSNGTSRFATGGRTTARAGGGSRPACRCTPSGIRAGSGRSSLFATSSGFRSSRTPPSRSAVRPGGVIPGPSGGWGP